MTNYQTLDDFIVGRIKNGSNTFIFIHSREVRDEAERLAELTKADAFRFTDKRLQALRKKGLIGFNSKTGWTAA